MSGLLTVAFVALLSLIGVGTFAVGYSARQAQIRTTALNQARMQSDDDLDTIRANVYLLGILTRDYLLDSDATSAVQYVAQYEEIRSSTERSFAHLAALKDTELPQDTLSGLRQEFNAYGDTTGVILRWSLEEKRRRGAEMLRRRLRRRQEVFALTEKVEQLVIANLERQRKLITQSDQQLRASLSWTSVVALLMGFVISGLTLMHTTRLERRSRTSELELRRLSGQLRTTQEQERKLLSRELHDQVGQLLAGLRLELNAVQRTVTEREAVLRLASAKRTVEQILNTVRNIAMLLRPSMLDDLGLVPALQWLCREMSRSGGIEIVMDADKTLNDLPDAHRTCLYRVVQEGLANAFHHSGARKVNVGLTMSLFEVSCTISDDGCGFDPESRMRQGLGLIGMQERVRDLGGSMRIVSFPGRGTRIEIRLPRPVPEVLDGKDSHRGRSRDRSDGFEASA